MKPLWSDKTSRIFDDESDLLKVGEEGPIFKKVYNYLNGIKKNEKKKDKKEKDKKKEDKKIEDKKKEDKKQENKKQKNKIDPNQRKCDVDLMTDKIKNSLYSSFLDVTNSFEEFKFIPISTISKDKITSNESIKEYTSGFTKIVSTINENLYKNSNDNSTVTLIVLGYGKIQNYLDKEKASNPGVITLDDLVGNSSNTRFRYIIYEPSSSFEKFKLFKIYDYIDDAYGIWVGSGFDEQMVFSTENVYSTEHTSRNDEIVTVINGECFFIKYVK